LHMAQLMPLPLTVSCSSKIQIGFTFLVPAYPGCPGKEAVKKKMVVVIFENINTVTNTNKSDRFLINQVLFQLCLVLPLLILIMMI